ncbi:DUF3772 domain-containing protein [Amaricoccus sp.]|uniref:DUF3772 domain-containing protein n=1 Tax=Amaricoccus sp. TaxID=1872485 RepID=UPI002BF283AF|nr:DUF3772 domain-containing protein [Amaricoccus sp.]HRW13778.1 DUF3772 domain-containing protein [Amaricoccus sp.]
MSPLARPGAEARMAGALRLAACLLLVLAAQLALPAQAQDQAQAQDDQAAVLFPEAEEASAPPQSASQTELTQEALKFASSTDVLADRAEERIGDETIPTPALESLRAELVTHRDKLQQMENQLASPVNDLKDRIKALGPPPAEGTTEAPEVARLRESLNAQLTEAQAPVLVVQEAIQRSSALISEIDRIIRARFSNLLLSHGASPLRPATWIIAAEELAADAARTAAHVRSVLNDPVDRANIVRRLPINILLVIAGLAVTFSLRWRLSDWIDGRLAEATTLSSVAWIVALRNINRLVMPAVGAGLLFAALEPQGLVGRAETRSFFALPEYILVLIGASWLGGSLFAPRSGAHRILPIDDAEARSGARLVGWIGVVLALAFLLVELATWWELSPATQSVLWFPVILAGSLLLWRAARQIRRLAHRMERAAAADRGETSGPGISVRLVRLTVPILRLLAIFAPIHAALGYIPAAAFMVFPMLMTLGLAGSALVVFDLLNKTLVSLVTRGRETSGDFDGGLIPILVGTLVILGSIPLIALIWGARPSDIRDTWVLLRDGVTVGGIPISFQVVVVFVAVFGLAVAATRVLQSVLKSTVLPRTRLDPGAKNAVHAGVGYVGFALAGIAGVSAAGVDLSSLAIVAGALSVGIGFGLQTVVSNFVSGIILLIERPIKEGDWIEVGGFSGYVRGIRVRSTEIETFDRASVIVPNSDLVAGSVLNRTHAGISGRLIVPVGVSYNSDPREVERILMEIAEEHPLVLDDPPPAVIFMSFGADCLNFEIRCRLRDVNFMLTVHSDMNFEIIARFRAAGISIPFPQRDVHIQGLDRIVGSIGPRPAGEEPA